MMIPRIGKMVVVALLFTVATALAQDAEHARRQADIWRSAAADNAGRFERFGEFTRGDIEQATKDFEQAAQAWENVAAAIETGEEEVMTAARERAEAMLPVRQMWQDRFDARMRQAGQAPTEEWIAKRWVSEAARPQFEAWVEARKAAAEAWDALAEAITPNASPEMVADLREHAQIADGEAGIAESQFVWARSLTSQLRDPSVSSEQLTLGLQHLREMEEAVVRERRALLEQRRKVLELEARRKQAEQQVHEAYGQAKESQVATVPAGQ